MSRKNQDKDKNKPAGDGNLTEDVLRDAGKSDREVESTGKVDRADEETDLLFEEKQRTANSPVHRVVWDRAGIRSFTPRELVRDEQVEKAVEASLAVVARHRAAGTLYDANNKVSDAVLTELGSAGYWGMLVPKQYGGQGASVRAFMDMLTRMSAENCPTTAGLASIHGCIGAVDPVSTFGSEEQKQYFLPKLASGETLSAFALTEPGAGSDLTALKTTAVLDGDHYVVNGRKLFISNAIPGRTIGLVCMINGKAAVLIVELPKEQNENFRIDSYPLHALTHTYNNGLVFTNFRVPKQNLLEAPGNNGLIIAYHGLNYGRIALCANAAGVMRILLKSIVPNNWGAYRKTYGEAIETRELVKRRVARLAALIVGADALVAWCSSIIDAGYRGELECIVAKIFGSEAQKEAAIELALKTHGGRSFLKGHIVGDNIHDYLAPCIYEGEGEMLGMAFFKSLAKEHGMTFMLPLGEAMKSLKKGNYGSGLWNLSKHGLSYAFWNLRKMLRLRTSQRVPGMSGRLQNHVNFALKQFSKFPLELTGAMRKHQLKLADRQCRIAHLSARVQDTMIILVTSLYANQSGDEATILAADLLCQDLRRKLTGEQPSDAYFKACSKLADMVIDGQFKQIAAVPGQTILQQYK